MDLVMRQLRLRQRQRHLIFKECDQDSLSERYSAGELPIQRERPAECLARNQLFGDFYQQLGFILHVSQRLLPAHLLNKLQTSAPLRVTFGGV